MDDSFRDLQVKKEKLMSCQEEYIRNASKTIQKPSCPTATPLEECDIKPSSPPVSLNELSPILCQSLAPDTIHWGRVLRGVIVARPWVMTGAHAIIEDEAGGFAEISFYNYAPNYLSRMRRTKVANTIFAVGKKVAIVEPLCKVGNDNIQEIIVENFVADVIFLEKLGPQCSQGWREEAKVHFSNQQLTEAIFSYGRSIDAHHGAKLAAALLSNIATCLLLKEFHGPSLLFAVSSFVVNSSTYRPFYTAGFCLNNLNYRELTFNCLEQCRKLNAPSKCRWQLREGLRNTKMEHIPASEWNEKVLSIMTSEHVHDLLKVESNDVVDSAQFKAKGNELFNKQQYDEAIREYCIGLRGFTEVSTLLTDRSNCYARIGKHAEAAMHALAAILITPKNAKAHYLKSLSLLQLNQKEEAVASCNNALEIVGMNSDLIELKERVDCVFKASSVNEPRLREQRTMTERELLEEQRDTMSSAELAMRSLMFDLMAPEEVLDDIVEQFHLEFSRTNGWPVESDTHLGMELLTKAYENARIRTQLHEIESENLSQVDKELLCKRLNSFEPEVLSWWFAAPYGTLSPRKRQSYSSNIHHSFTNSPCNPNEMRFGTVHVSVGFVDLSGLLFCNLTSSAEQGGPLRWIGYEASAYSAAKSLIIAHMMRRGANTDCILQVWYSSSWSKKTLSSFRKTLRDLITLTREAAKTEYSAEVVSLWQHWNQFDITLRTARSKWLSRHSLHNHAAIANFRRKLDRLAVCRYLVSGEVLEGEVGSVVMFGLPGTKDDGEYEIALNEYFLHCLPIHKVVNGVDEETSFIDAAIDILRRRVSNLKELVSTGAITIEIHHKMVELSEKPVIREIRNLSAHSISWSNLCDYCSNEEFHEMTLACSGTDTTHYLSSTNWCTEVKGTFMIDYPTDTQEDVLREGKKAISYYYCLTGLIHYLHIPPITSHNNIGSYMLCQNMHKKWTANFFEAAGLENDWQAVVQSVAFDVLARSQNTINIVYTFNKNKPLKV